MPLRNWRVCKNDARTLVYIALEVIPRGTTPWSSCKDDGPWPFRLFNLNNLVSPTSRPWYAVSRSNDNTTHFSPTFQTCAVEVSKHHHRPFATITPGLPTLHKKRPPPSMRHLVHKNKIGSTSRHTPRMDNKRPHFRWSPSPPIPTTVPGNTSRLRVTAKAAHRENTEQRKRSATPLANRV